VGTLLLGAPYVERDLHGRRLIVPDIYTYTREGFLTFRETSASMTTSEFSRTITGLTSGAGRVGDHTTRAPCETDRRVTVRTSPTSPPIRQHGPRRGGGSSSTRNRIRNCLSALHQF
jgi:hypothetical protein